MSGAWSGRGFISPGCARACPVLLLGLDASQRGQPWAGQPAGFRLGQRAMQPHGGHSSALSPSSGVPGAEGVLGPEERPASSRLGLLPPPRARGRFSQQLWSALRPWALRTGVQF